MFIKMLQKCPTENPVKPFDALLIKLKYCSTSQKTFHCCMSLSLLFTAIKTITSLKKPSLMYLRHLGVNT